MTAEQIERNRAFLADLRANKKKAKGKMRDPEGGRCCLCVAFDTAQKLGAELRRETNLLPPSEIGEFYGWSTARQQTFNPKLKYGGVKACAAEFNDGINSVPELTHAQIADAFEETFPELKEGKP